MHDLQTTNAIATLERAKDLYSRSEDRVKEASKDLEIARVILVRAQAEYDILFPPPTKIALPTHTTHLRILRYCAQGKTLTEVYKETGLTKAYASVMLCSMIEKKLMYRPNRGMYVTFPEVLAQLKDAT